VDSDFEKVDKNEMISLFHFLTRTESPGLRLGIETERGQFELSDFLVPGFFSMEAWLRHPDPIAWIQERAERVSAPLPPDAVIVAPVGQQEVWAAGVTYERSRVARMEESADGGDFYDKVYAADRPELFLKAVASRVVGPNSPVRIRKDSTWNVPEPEMTLVIAANGNIVGYTAGNDMSSRSIEGENPLYLPQAKCYDGACALGPRIVVVENLEVLRHRAIRLEIRRDGATVYEDVTTTSRMKRTPEELRDYLFREMSFPNGVFLMTGTGLIPPDDFTLQSGDVVSISVEDAGTLTNPVA
jgi:2-dehydro-3-deoxy-D-arabinonate dehydratase